MTIESDALHVWLMPVDAPPPALLADWRRCLDADERARADRFYFERDRVIYTAAHWLLRSALTEVAGLPAAEWRFTAGPHGKPRIDPALCYDALSFNLSHTKGLVACAITHQAEIGIDVERMEPRRAGLDIAEHFFSVAEIELLRAMPPAQQIPTFFRLWTLKEALIKTTGEGLQRALHSFSFALDPVAVAFHPHDPDEAARWSFWELEPTAHHAAALAIRQQAPRPIRLVTTRLQIGSDGRLAAERSEMAMRFPATARQKRPITRLEKLANHNPLVYFAESEECSMVADSDSRIAWHRAQLKKHRAELKQIETIRFTVGESSDIGDLDKSKRQLAELKDKIRESEQIIAQHDKQTRRPLGTDLRSLTSVSWRNWDANSPR
jgi:4'-phosphopantetheinyl transferase